MRRVALLFPQAADIWNFLVLTGESAIRVEKHTLEGYFTRAEIELACSFFMARVQEDDSLDVL